MSSDSESDTEPIDFEKLSKQREVKRKNFWKKFDDGNLSYFSILLKTNSIHTIIIHTVISNISCSTEKQMYIQNTNVKHTCIQYSNEVTFSTVIWVYKLFSTIKTNFFQKYKKKFITDFKTEPDEFDSDESLPDIPPPSYIERNPQAKDDNNFKPSPPKKPIRYM